MENLSLSVDISLFFVKNATVWKKLYKFVFSLLENLTDFVEDSSFFLNYVFN